ncbi:hypothetical protein [Telmatospirillum siberiense]|uniref:Uncharacterized protein n=1 Tax=Telmatospirillum siberiense TaxID=382514 RepID=A0A2N3PXW4_9PROT|nr:hypothetical protein [Telmatospirillum siberiense]PKU25252.1 hypothetical protein CWS72_06510 [Telmatospirillum siberiense]
MTFHYYVAISAQGVTGLAATKQSAVEEEAAKSGAEVIMVDSPNAFLARRKAVASWSARQPSH